MHPLVLYDSKYGNTQRIAEVIADRMNTQAIRVDQVTDDMLDDVDTVVVGSPTQAWHASPATKLLIERLKTNHTKGLMAAAFDTGFDKWYAGSAAKDIANQLRKAGCTIIAQPKHFIVQGTEGPLADDALAQAKQWADDIRQGV